MHTSRVVAEALRPPASALEAPTAQQPATPAASSSAAPPAASPTRSHAALLRRHMPPLRSRVHPEQKTLAGENSRGIEREHAQLAIPSTALTTTAKRRYTQPPAAYWARALLACWKPVALHCPRSTTAPEASESGTGTALSGTTRSCRGCRGCSLGRKCSMNLATPAFKPALTPRAPGLHSPFRNVAPRTLPHHTTYPWCIWDEGWGTADAGWR